MQRSIGIGCAIIAGLLIAGFFPVVAVMLTGLGIVAIFLIFKNN
jgi:hypothetical protein